MNAFTIEFAAKIFLEPSSKSNIYATQNFQAVAIFNNANIILFQK